jgi:molecular chaperone DnaK
LSKDEVEKMKIDAQRHAAEDSKRKEEIELKNQADNLVFSTKKQLKDLGDKLPADVKAKLEAAATALEEAIKANNAADIKAKVEALNTIWNEASAHMYDAAKQQAPGAQPGPEPGPGASQQSGAGPKDDKKVENADFEVVDDK